MSAMRKNVSSGSADGDPIDIAKEEVIWLTHAFNWRVHFLATQKLLSNDLDIDFTL